MRVNERGPGVEGPGTGATVAGAGGGWRDWVDPRRVGWIKLLLVFVPITLALDWTGAPGAWQFTSALLAIIPLAAVMGEATEKLAHRAGPGIGGLLNASFGNAAELIIALSLLFEGKDTAVKASLTGSILGNILLVLGGALFAGGLRHPVQRFNRTAAGTGATMMVLAAMGMVVPAIIFALPEVTALGPEKALNIEHELSLAVSGLLIGTYILSLLFSLKTHKDLYNPADDESEPIPAHGGRGVVVRAIVILLIATVAVAMVSEVLAGTIEDAGEKLGMTQLFLGAVVIAIVGNAAEHSTAILVAIKNKADLAVGIALGSALQVAMFVAPVLVFASYLRPAALGPMDLLFTTLEIVAVILGVLIARMVAEDGESHWLEGAMLLMIYAILGAAFFVAPEPPEARRPAAGVTVPPPSLSPGPPGDR